MGRKIFVSYKYSDNQVEKLSSWNTTARDYVTEFEKLIDSSDHIYKGESDDESLASLDEYTIWEKLKNRIYDSSITVIFISPAMKESFRQDKDQWIPWEVSYSLKETSRKNKNGDRITSKTNAMLAVVLPDINGSYSYYLETKSCCESTCRTHHTYKLFQIIKDNMFNLKNAQKRVCNNGSSIWSGEVSYIGVVKWCDFKKDYNKYINDAVYRQENIDSYEIVKQIK